MYLWAVGDGRGSYKHVFACVIMIAVAVMNEYLCKNNHTNIHTTDNEKKNINGDVMMKQI